MNISIPSPKYKRYRDVEDIESSKSPSNQPLMYSSPSSSSDEELLDLEDVPILPNLNSPCNDEINRRRKPPFQRERVCCAPRFRSCIAVMALALVSFIYSVNHSTSDSIKTIASEIVKEQGNTDQIIDEDEGISPSSSPTLDPTLRPTPGLSVDPKRNSPFPNPISTASTDLSSHHSETKKKVVTKKKKNNLVLHVGPQKTGSTTLQDAWTYPYGMLSQPLKQDNYRYEFVHRKSGYFNCDMSSYGGLLNCKFSPKLKDLIRTTKSAGQNLLLSDENLGDQFSETLRDVIDDDDWDVTVIIVYRRIHQWLVSWYDQINKTTNKDSKGNILFDKHGNTYRKEHTLWPDEGGTEIPTFSSWYKQFTRHWDRSELVSKHRSIEFMNAYKPYFSNIVVHNMHQDGDLMTNFMCDSFPNGKHCCNRLKSQSQRLPRDNQSVNLNYDILAVRARESGILMTGLSRKEAAKAIEKFTKKNGKNIPLICDTNVVDEIKRWLLDSEKTVFRETWSDQKTSDLKDLFDSYLDDGKLCDVDFEEVFHDSEWIEFFKSLDNRPHLVLHVGPQTSGAKILQRVWDIPEELGQLLQKDNFEYHYINPHRGMFDCGVKKDMFSDCQASQKLVQTLANASLQRKNLILSDENLDERFSKALSDVIDAKHFRVKVVVMYRKINRWLPYWYRLINNTTNIDANGDILHNQNGQPVRQPHKHWPRKGGVSIPNFSDWYRDFVHGLDPDNLASAHRSITFKNAYEALFDHVEVYNEDQEGNLVTNFMCQMIPESSTTCNRLKQGKVDVAIDNALETVEEDILSVKAYENGLVEENLSRPLVVSKVRKYIQQYDIKLPRRCDTEVISQIHEWLLNSEKLLFQEDWTASATDALERKFSSDSSTGELCDIDVEKILSDQNWIDFFGSL